MRSLRPRKARDLPKVSQLGSGQVSLKPGQSGYRSHSPNHTPKPKLYCTCQCAGPGHYSFRFTVFISSTCLVPEMRGNDPICLRRKDCFFSNEASVLLLDTSFSRPQFLSQLGSKLKSNLLNYLKTVMNSPT